MGDTKGKAIMKEDAPVTFPKGNPLKKITHNNMNEFWDTMQPTVWIIRIRVPSKLKHEEVEEEDKEVKETSVFNEEGEEICVMADEMEEEGEEKEVDDVSFEYFYMSGVCIDTSGTILSSNQILQIPGLPKISECYLEGRCGDGVYQQLKLKMRCPIGEDYALFAPLRASPPYKFAKFHLGRIEVGCEALVIGNPFSLRFPLLLGYLTHSCHEYDTNVVNMNRTLEQDRSFLTVKDVLFKTEYKRTMLLDGQNIEFHTIVVDQGLKLKLDFLPNTPLLSISGVTPWKGLSGSPIFNVNGLLIGLVSFGDGVFAYGMPASFIEKSMIEKQQHVKKRKSQRL